MGESFRKKLAAFLVANLKEWPEGVVGFGPMTSFNVMVGREDLGSLYTDPAAFNAEKDSLNLEDGCTEWDGEGIPPVGCSCNMTIKPSLQLGVCEVLFVGNTVMAWRQKSTGSEGFAPHRNMEFHNANTLEHDE